MIDNNVHILVERVLRSNHEYKDNWPEGSNFASASARGQRYFKIDIFTPKSTPQVLLMHMQTFYPEVKRFKQKWR